MYFVKYGNEYLHDPRDSELVLGDLSLDCEENSCGFCDFTIYPNHPMYDKIRERDANNPIEVYDDDILLFSGFIYELGKEFYLDGHVKCKGDLDYLRDTIVRPYSTHSSNVVKTVSSNPSEYFEWLIEQHNSQVDNNKRFVIGKNEVSKLDSNFYIYRENKTYPTTIDEISEKILKKIGGYLSVHKENGIRYIDFLAEQRGSNTQILDFGVNLTNYTQTDDSSEIATFVVPIGAKLSETVYWYDDGYRPTSDYSPDLGKDYYTRSDDGYYSKCSSSMTSFESGVTYYEYYKEYDESDLNLTIKKVPNAHCEDQDFFKYEDMIYSQSAVSKYGWIGTVYHNSDVTVRENLVSKGIVHLKELISPKRTLEIKAVDMHLVNPNIKPIRIGEYVRVRSDPHKLDSYFLCSSIDLDLNNPENSLYTLGTTFDTLTDQQNKILKELNAKTNKEYELADKIANLEKAQEIIPILPNPTDPDVGGDTSQKIYIRYSENSDGSDMTTTPNDKTVYMGICITIAHIAPDEYTAYTWSKIRGEDGQSITGSDGKSAYLHIKYSDDGLAFTDNNGETAGDWIGTYSDDNSDGSMIFSDYTWKKIKGEQGIRGEKGEQGEKGIRGETGNGIQSVEITYLISESGTTAPTGSWSSSIPVTTEYEPYLWTKTYILYTDGSSSVSYSVSSSIESIKDKIEELGRNDILWSGAYHMDGNQTITLSSDISRQLSGAVFVWSYYNGSSASNENMTYFFVPKSHVINCPGDPITMSDPYLGMNKRLYISNGNVTGYVNNSLDGSTNGIAWTNSNYVLRYVIGV